MPFAFLALRFWHIPTGAALILLLFILASSQADSPGISEKEAVRQVLDAQGAAWNRGNLKGFMAGYWKSDNLSFFSGKDKTHGWQATLERYQKRYQAEGREMGKLSFSELEIEAIGPDAAWVRGRWKVVTSK